MNIQMETSLRSDYHLHAPMKRVLAEDISCRIGRRKFTAKKGIWWDGMSMPRLLWPIMGTPFTGKTLVPTFWHDVFFATHYFNCIYCNKILEEMNSACGVSFVKRKLITGGLYAGSWVAYNAKTEKQIEGAMKHLEVEDI